MDLKALAQDFDLGKLTVALRGWFPSFAEKNKTLKFPGWDGVEVLGVVETLAGPNGANMPMVVAAAKSPTGQTLTERSSRVRQFKLAKDILQVAFENPLQIGIGHGVQGAVAQGLFAFYDDEGNFRLSLVHATPKGKTVEWSQIRRQSFYVDAKGENQTFRQRMGGPFGTWDQLREAFSVERLAKEFYVRLFDWYERACKNEKVVFPNDVDTDGDNRAHIEEHMIRLITRLMFVWFLKQKKLVPAGLFDEAHLAEILKTFKPRSKTEHNYYNAILQNLFFATLNSEITGEDSRAFAVKGTRGHGVKTLYRHADEFKISKPEVMKEFEQAPFLNGGLFECLDKMDDDNKVLYYDGFSNEDRHIYKGTLTRAHVPNYLFFDPEIGILPLFKQYNFTVTENSQRDEDVALDPELLGQVFENLLGAFNPETKMSARDMTGSFYTPREIVDYMVDESLKAILAAKCPTVAGERLERLFAAESERPADGKLCRELDKALTTAKYLDPACGSGAFPMGILLRVVELLRILRGLPEDASTYGLKLELIENCIYGIDIQTIAVQVSKLRFFISLVCEQIPTDDKNENYGIHTLPNLETKFVAANSLIGLHSRRQAAATGKKLSKKEREAAVPLLLVNEVEKLKADLWRVRHRHFNARTRGEKKSLRDEDKRLRKALALTLQETSVFDVKDAEQMAKWDPYDQNLSSAFFDAEWMFNIKDGFDIVIGNPPYGFRNILSPEEKKYFRKVEGIVFPTGDIAELFILKSLGQYVANAGMLTFIIPKKSLYGESWSNVRRLWLGNSLHFLMDASKAFENVLLEQAAFAVRKGRPEGRKIAVGYLNGDLQAVCELGQFPSDNIFTPDAANAQIYRGLYAPSLLEKIQKHSAGAVGKCISAEIGISNITSELTFDAEGNVPCLKGKDIVRYGHRGDVRYLKKRTADRVSDGFQPATLVAQKIIAHLANPISHIQIAIEYNEPSVLYNDTCVGLHITDPRLDKLFMLGYLQSNFAGWYAHNFIYNRAIRTMDFISYYVSQLPFPQKAISCPKCQEEIAALVKQAIKLRRVDAAANIDDIEARINAQVYELYGLTGDEISIVEGLSEAESGPKRAKSEKPKKARGRKKVEVDLPASLPGWD